MKIIKCFIVLIIITTTILSENHFTESEWKKLTVQQRWDAMNLGRAKLDKMTTKELLDHCLDFNFMYDVYNYRNFKEGIDVVYKNHDALRELLNRKDVVEVIERYYSDMDPKKILKIDKSIERGRFSSKLLFIELFIWHPVVTEKLSGREKELIGLILRKHNECQKVNNNHGGKLFGMNCFLSKAVLLDKILARNKKSGNICPGTKDMDLSKMTEEMYKKIIENANGFL